MAGATILCQSGFAGAALNRRAPISVAGPISAAVKLGSSSSLRGLRLPGSLSSRTAAPCKRTLCPMVRQQRTPGDLTLNRALRPSILCASARADSGVEMANCATTGGSLCLQ